MTRPKLSNAELNEILDKVKHDQMAEEALIEEKPKPTDDQIADYIAKHSKYSTKQIADHFHIEQEDVLQVKITKADEIKMISTAFAKAQEHEKAKKAQQENPVMKPEVVMAAREMAEGAVENKPEKAELTEQDKAKAEELADKITNAKPVTEDPNFVLVNRPEENVKKALTVTAAPKEQTAAPKEKVMAVCDDGVNAFVEKPVPGGVRVSVKPLSEVETAPAEKEEPKPEAKPKKKFEEPKIEFVPMEKLPPETAKYVVLVQGVEAHRRICQSLNDIYARKNHDYGDSFHELYQKYGPQYLLMHLEEKLKRIETLASGKTAKVKSESLRDSLKDLANYAILGMMEIGEDAK